MITREIKLKAALKAVDFLKGEMVKAINSKSFKEMDEESKNDLLGALDNLKSFSIANTDYDYTDEEIDELIEDVKTLIEKIYYK